MAASLAGDGPTRKRLRQELTTARCAFHSVAHLHRSLLSGTAPRGDGSRGAPLSTGSWRGGRRHHRLAWAARRRLGHRVVNRRSVPSARRCAVHTANTVCTVRWHTNAPLRPRTQRRIELRRRQRIQKAYPSCAEAHDSVVSLPASIASVPAVGNVVGVVYTMRT
jgi:hypothetical protein